VKAQIYEVTISHARSAPLRNVFRYRSYLWLVDLDHLPRVPLLATFRARDHLGDPRASIRVNLDRFLAARGVDLGGGRVTMLAQAAVLGYVFNPLTVYWCHRADGSLACVVAEVHNTYRQRHAYLLPGVRATVPKDFYVSPFYPVDGRYRMSLPEPALGGRLALSVRLERPDGHSLAASVRGRAVPATMRALLGAAVRHPWSTAAVSARIRWQGVRLYRRGLPVIPRPAHLPQEGVQ
jgi:DUF1365 family protein